MMRLRWNHLTNSSPRKVLPAFILLLVFFYIISFFKSEKCQVISSREIVVGEDGKAHSYNRSSPFIFVGGFPRSGTTLVRAMLDAHTDIRCGEETRVIPRILQLIEQWKRSKKEANRLKEAGMSDQVISDAVASFILEVIVKHGHPAPRLCNKDPFTLKYASYLLRLFPNSKFIFMVRDGRAVVHSMISRQVSVTGFNLTDYRQCLRKWSRSVRTMANECDSIGDKCLRVKYEELVLHPKREMERILKYLDLPWMDEVLHHERFINKPGGVSLSKMERSSDQVVKPVNSEALTKWVGKIPKDVVAEMARVAPMLKKLGYNPRANPPKYGEPDKEVVVNTKDVINNQGKWESVAENSLKSKS